MSINFVTAFLVCAAHVHSTQEEATPRVPVAYPHPLVTEVLFDVPKGKEGDADQNGSRSAQGDEFVEVVNPHDKPINLKGYVITDSEKGRPPRSSSDKNDDKNSKPKRESTSEESRVRFVFPDCELAPGEVAVVFNGFESGPPGPVGDASGEKDANPKFSGARVFTMRNPSRYAAFSNTSDCVRLLAPTGECVQCVSWGDAAKDACAGATLSESVSTVQVSVQRRSVADGFIPHDQLDSRPCSPGRFAATPVTVKRNAPSESPSRRDDK